MEDARELPSLFVLPVKYRVCGRELFEWPPPSWRRLMFGMVDANDHSDGLGHEH